MNEDKCLFCNNLLHNGEETTTLHEKGIQGIQNACKKRKLSNPEIGIGRKVHKKCRSRFINFRRNNDECIPITEYNQLPADSNFEFENNCLFCSKKLSEWLFRDKKASYVKNTNYCKTLLEISDLRKDKWSDEVSTRIKSTLNLQASGAAYHRQCDANFRTNKQIPTKYDDNNVKISLKSGRRDDEERHTAFMNVVQYIERNDEKQHSVSDLLDEMAKYLPIDGSILPYTAKYMQKKLFQYFDGEIVFSSLNGVPNILTFKKSASAILNNCFYKPEEDDCEESKMKIILQAAEIIKTEIRDLGENVPTNKYPTSNEISDVDYNCNYIPTHLKMFLSTLVSGKEKQRKVSAIGQTIIQAVSPRLNVTPLQLGLGVFIHHNTGSRFLVDTLHQMGFSCSYLEVLKYLRCAAVAEAKCPIELQTSGSGTFVQYAADNVDHNIVTLDGAGTFHGMGIIGMTTPKVNESASVFRRHVSLDEIKELGKINIHVPTTNCCCPRLLSYKPIRDEISKYHDPSKDLDSLWGLSHFLKTPVPQWHGFCQMVHKGGHPGEATITFLPMIDMDPTNATCIYSTLCFISDQAKKCNHTPVLTFDQPLFLKASSIIANEHSESQLKKIILKLGGLHIQMSFLGAIGKIMAGSGIKEILEIVYGENAVKHMLSGKAISRAIRGHFILYISLMTILAEEVITDDNINCADTENLKSILTEILNREVLVEDALPCQSLANVQDKIKIFMSSRKDSRTSALWFQYMKMIDILRNFIKGERLGDWCLHLASINDMLPFFASSGHNKYTTSARLYLQNMLELEESSPDIYEKFFNGLFVVRRSDRLWGGLSTDLIIEQCLMKSIKGNGGLTRGRGMTESQRALWTLSRPMCAQVNMAVQDFAGTSFHTSDQHVTATTSRMNRDNEDTEKVLQFCRPLNIFGETHELRNIVSGVTDDNKCNCERAEQIGCEILNSMTGKSVDEFKFKKCNQVKTLDINHTISFDKDTVKIDPELLFQRLIVCAQTNDIRLENIMSFELSTFPAAIFDSHGMMREAYKSKLSQKLSEVTESGNLDDGPFNVVMDGGSLLHKIPWVKNETFCDIVKKYVRYVNSNYGKPTIVFDGYESNSTKDQTHIRRKKDRCGPTILFQSNTTLTIKKEDFLANFNNKQRFIQLLSNDLVSSGCTVRQAKDDADLLIVNTTIEEAKLRQTVLVGEDTDILVLLLHYISETDNNIFFCPSFNTKNKKIFMFDIKRIRDILGRCVSSLLFTHAFTGCDTTSRIYSVSKTEAFKILSNDEFGFQAKKFYEQGINSDVIVAAGEKAMVALFGGSPDESINEIRLKHFKKKVSKASSGHVKPENLPPTADACSFHSLRVYHQIQAWLGNDINPLEWGWKMKGSVFAPITCSMQPAPASLLKMIKCSCTKTRCQTMQCSCRKQGLFCTDACLECEGMNCSNSEPFSDYKEDDD